MRRDEFVQGAFLLAAFSVMLTALMMRTGGRDASPLDGLYVPILFLVATYVALFLVNIPCQRFVAYSIVFLTVLNIMPALKYEFLRGGDVNYMYRLLTTVNEASNYNALQALPSSLTGIYLDFPGFILINVIFVKVTGLPAIEGYKLFHPIVYGIVYPASFFLLSSIVTRSALVRRAVVMAAVIPYAIYPGVVWNTFMMPNYFGFLIIPIILYLVLKRTSSELLAGSAVLFFLLQAALSVMHPVAALYTVTALSGLLVVKAVVDKVAAARPSSLLSPALIIFGWATTIGWSAYSNPSGPFLLDAMTRVIAFIILGIEFPSLTGRLESFGPLVFLISHMSKIILGVLAFFGIFGLLRRKIPDTKVEAWILAASLFLALYGISFMPFGFTFLDIYVAYRSLFFTMTVVTLAAGLGLSMLVKPVLEGTFNGRNLRRTLLVGAIMFTILAVSLFDLYPTEYVNPSAQNSVHTIYQKNAVGFLNSHWASSSQVIANRLTYQVFQSFASLDLYRSVVSPVDLPYIRLRDPLTTVINAEAYDGKTANLIYSSGFIVINATLT